MNSRIDFKKKEDLLFFFKNVAIVVSCHLIFYVVPNYLAQFKDSYIHGYLDWELENIKIIPAFIFIYISSYPQLLVPALVSKKRQIIPYVRALFIASAISGIIFYLFPSVQGFPRDPESIDQFQSIFKWLYSVDPPHNLFPSMHICYSTITSYILFKLVKTWWFRGPLLIWQNLLYLSVLFTHQHHIIDIILGLALSWFALYLSGIFVEFNEQKKEASFLASKFIKFTNRILRI